MWFSKKKKSEVTLFSRESVGMRQTVKFPPLLNELELTRGDANSIIFSTSVFTISVMLQTNITFPVSLKLFL